MIDALDHVIVATGDLDAATRHYEVVLGLAPSWRGEHPGAGTSNVLFRLENTYIELLAARGEGPLADLLRARIESEGDGMLGLAFGTHDLDATLAGLAARGMNPGPAEAGSGHDSVTGAERRWRRAGLPFDRTRGMVLFPIQHDSPVDALPMARPIGRADACVHALDHVVVQTADAEGAKALFGDALGLRLAVDKEFASWGVRLMFFRLSGLTVEVAAALPAGGSLPESRSDRLYGMSYRVRSIEAAHARLRETGVDVSDVRTGRRPCTRVCTVRERTCGVPTLFIEFEANARA